MTETASKRVWSRWVFAALSLILGLGLFILLARLGYINITSFYRDLSGTRPTWLALIAASTLFHFWITARRWRLVTEQMVASVKLKSGFMYYTALAGLISQVLPQQLTVTAVRTLALKTHEDLPVGKGASSAIFDQAFDILVPATLVVPAILVFLKIIGPWIGVALGAAVLVTVGTAFVFYTGPLFRTIWRLGRLIPVIGRRLPESWGAQNSSTAHRLFDRRIILKIFILSTIRYLNLTLRACFVIPAAGLGLPVWPVAFGYSLVTLSAVLSLTPANLGIAEWGWIGLFKVAALGGDATVSFAVLNRLYTVVGILAAGAVVLIWALWAYLGKRRWQAIE